MNDTCCPQSRITGVFFAILGTFLIVGALVWAMVHYTRPAPLGTERVAERKKALSELNAANVEALNTPGWVDQGKGIVRLPISNAMELVVKEYANPVAARSNLVAAADKANFKPPPPPPPPNPFE